MKMQWTHRPLLLLAAMLLIISAATPSFAAEPILVDGRFEDWGEVVPVAVDPAGDASGAFDLRRLYLRSWEDQLFVRFEITRPLSLQSGPADEGTLRMKVYRPWEPLHLEVDFRGRELTLNKGDETIRLGWADVDYAIGPTHAAKAFEVRLDVGWLGLNERDPIVVQFSGSDGFSRPIPFLLWNRPRPMVRMQQPRSLERSAPVDFRAVSFNVQRDGLTDAKRREKIGRILRALEGDVLCLQEVYRPDEQEIAGTLKKIHGGGDEGHGESGGGWHAHKEDDCVIAARWPVVGVEADEHGYAAAIVRHPNCGPLLVLSVHARCCGYFGSEEDERRVEQATAMAKTIRKVRNAEPGTDLHPYRDAPIILAGDMNLVGATEPLDILTEGSSPGLKRWRLRQFGERSVMTWINPGSSFAPGLLDMMFYAPGRLKPLNGFILNGGAFRDATLEELNLKRGDSDASDHLPLVGDFAVE